MAGPNKWGQPRGFTIVELLIVVVVIAILAAITIVAYNGISNQAKDSATRSTVSQIKKGLKLQQAENSSGNPIADMADFQDDYSALARTQLLQRNNLSDLSERSCLLHLDGGLYGGNPEGCDFEHVEGEVTDFDRNKVFITLYGDPDNHYVEIAFYSSRDQYWDINTYWKHTPDGGTTWEVYENNRLEPCGPIGNWYVTGCVWQEPYIAV